MQDTAVLTDPLRQHILQNLGTGATVAELSQRLQITDARLFYHLKRLAQIDALRLEEQGTNPRAWRCLPPETAAELPPQNDATAAIPPDVAAQFNQAQREAAEGLYGSDHQFSINHNRARLSTAQAADFNRRLLALIEEYFPPGKGDRAGVKYGFYAVLTPIDLHPLDE